jgi:aquaporin Z
MQDERRGPRASALAYWPKVQCLASQLWFRAVREKLIAESNMRRCVAELVGTFVLVFAGCGSAVIAGDTIGNAGIALAFGLSLLAMVQAVGPISGAHLNPAVTAAVLIIGKIEPTYALAYVFAQCLGSTIAAAAIFFIASGVAGGYDPSTQGLAANGYGQHSPAGYDAIAAMSTEAVLTFILVFTVLTVMEHPGKGNIGGIAIGTTLVAVHLIGIPVTNTSVNPARSLGPALFVGGWALKQLWLFIVAPLLGSVCAALLHQLIGGREIRGARSRP